MKSKDNFNFIFNSYKFLGLPYFSKWHFLSGVTAIKEKNWTETSVQYTEHLSGHVEPQNETQGIPK